MPTGWIEGFFASGRVADFAMIILIIETVVLMTRPALKPQRGSIVLNALSGLALIGALRAALVGAGPTWIGVCLLAGLLAHLAELRLRLKRR